MNKIKVSIIMPVFNSERFIALAINSVINQTYQNWELIMVDDCSKDNSVTIIKKYLQKDKRLKFYPFKENQGAGPARNKAIKMAKGEIIAFLDSDDIWHSLKLEKHLAFMIKNDSAFSHTSYGYIDEKGCTINKTFVVSDNNVTYKNLLKRTEISCLTAMYDVRKVGKVFMPNIRRKQDYSLWLTILKKGFVSYPLNEELAYYRQVKGSATNNKFKLIGKHFKFLRKVEKLDLFATIYYTYCWAINGLKKYYLSKL